MKEFFFKYIDLVTIIITLAWTIGATIFAIKRGGKGLRVALMPLVFLGPVMLISCMFTHLAEISFHAVDSDFTGKFSLRFYLYALYLMPLVLGNAGIYMYRGMLCFLSDAATSKKEVLQPAGIIALVLFPLLWLTPLAAVMYVVVGISVAALFAVRKRESADYDLDMLTLQEATA